MCRAVWWKAAVKNPVLLAAGSLLGRWLLGPNLPVKLPVKLPSARGASLWARLEKQNSGLFIPRETQSCTATAEVLLAACLVLTPVLSWSRYLDSHYNLPEEHDETMSTMGQKASHVCSPGSTSSPADHSVPPEYVTLADDSSFGMVRDLEPGHEPSLPPPGLSFLSYPRPHSFAVAYNQPTPFPSRAHGSWLHPSLASSWSGYPKSLPSYLNRKDFPSSAGSEWLSGCRSLSLPGSTSLEQPLSLCSNPPSASLRHHKLSPYSCQPPGAGCCAQCPAEPFSRRAVPNKPPWPPYHPAHGACCKFASHLPAVSTCRR